MAIDAVETQALLQWTEAVAYTSVRDAGDVELVEVPAGVYRVGLREAARSHGVYLASDIRVTLGMGDVAAGGVEFPPKPRDLVEWSDVGEDLVYVVLDASGTKWQRFWSLTCRCPRIAYDLRQTATVKRPATSATADGLRRVPTYATLATVDCRLQPETNSAEFDQLGGEVTRRKFTAFLAGSHSLRSGDAIEVGGVKYDVTSQGDIDQLGTLTRVACEDVLP